MQRASVRSASPMAARWRVPYWGGTSRRWVSGSTAPAWLMRAPSMTTAPSCSGDDFWNNASMRGFEISAPENGTAFQQFADGLLPGDHEQGSESIRSQLE